MNNITSENLPTVLTEVCNYIKEEHSDITSLKDIANSINISPSYLSGLKSTKSKVSHSSRFTHLIKICRKYEITTNVSRDSISITKGFDREKYSNQSVIILWSKKQDEIRFIKVYNYSFLEFELVDISSKKPFKMGRSYDSGNSIIYSEELDEYYKFESLKIPGSVHYPYEQYLFDDNDDIPFRERDENEFYVGKETSENYLGSLFLTFEMKFFELVKDNIEFFKLFLTNRELQESLPASITSFDELMSFIQSFNAQKRKFKISLPKSLSRIYHQFLSYFVEFVEKAKGQKIRFDVFNRDSFLEIEIWANHEKDVDDIAIYLEEYFNLLNQDTSNLRVEVEKEMSKNEFNLLVFDLKQQINHLKQSLEIAKLGEGMLKDEVKYLREIVNQMTVSKLPPPTISIEGGHSKSEQLLNLLSKNRIQECIDMLMDISSASSNKNLLKEVIIQSSKFSENEGYRRHGILLPQEIDMNKSRIVAALTDLVQENL